MLPRKAKTKSIIDFFYGNLVGVTRQTIIALEAGKYVPSLGLAFRIARIFGVTVEEVFWYEE